ncbi:hypothetical protein RI367_003248 [Sorochytrium milnesiophthora]
MDPVAVKFGRLAFAAPAAAASSGVGCFACCPTSTSSGAGDSSWRDVALEVDPVAGLLRLTSTAADADTVSVARSFVVACTPYVSPKVAAGASLMRTVELVGEARTDPSNALFAVHYVDYVPYTKEKPAFQSWILKAESAAQAQECIAAISAFLVSGDAIKKRFLVLVNPVSGHRRAVVVAKTIIAPMLSLAGIASDVVETTGRNFAHDYVQQIALDQYTALLTVGGDGITHEVFNGLLARPDWREARKLPIAVIAAGSGNGLAKSLDVVDPLLGALSAVKTRVSPLDMMSLSTEAQDGGLNVLCYTHLSLTWAFIADVDIGSEVIRSWAGPARMDLWAVMRILSKKMYAGRVSVLLADDAAPVAADQYSNAGEAPAVHGPLPQYAHASIAAIRGQEGRQVGWRQLPMSLYYLFIVGNVPWLSQEFNATPLALLNDGAAHFVYANKMTTGQLMPIFADQAAGTYVATPPLTSVKIKAMVVEPAHPTDPNWHQLFDQPPADDLVGSKLLKTQSYGADAPQWKKQCAREGHGIRKHGYMAADGEEIPSGPIRLEVHQGLTHLVVPEWLDERQASKNLTSHA